MFVNPVYDASNRWSPKTVQSREIKDNDSTNNIRYACNDFYGHWTIWGSDTAVTKYETNDAFETVDSGATQTVYTVRVKKAINAAGFS
jgi:hypothetical protein